jgi:hypothetical protein
MSVDVTARKVEIEQTVQMLQEAQKAHDKAIAESYEQLRNLLSGDAQSQWDRVCPEMHECDSWAVVNGQVTKGRCPRTWMSFLDCLKLHKLTVFSADAAKRQRFYIQQAVRKPQRATVHQHISQMGVLNDYVKHLPTLKDSSKAVPTTKKGNIPFGKADLAVEWTQNAHQTLLFFKTHLPLITILHESYIPPVLANDALPPPRPLVDGNQRKDAGIIADQNPVHVFIVDVPALTAPKAHGGRGGHGRQGPRMQRSRQLVSDKQTSLVRRLKHGRRLPDV